MGSPVCPPPGWVLDLEGLLCHHRVGERETPKLCLLPALPGRGDVPGSACALWPHQRMSDKPRRPSGKGGQHGSGGIRAQGRELETHCSLSLLRCCGWREAATVLMVNQDLCGGEQLVPFGKQLPRGRHRTRSSLPNVSCPFLPSLPSVSFPWDCTSPQTVALNMFF